MNKILFLLFLVCAGAVAQAQQVIKVPEGKGSPVLIDGQVLDDEWRDAFSVNVDPSLRIYFKQLRGHFYIAVKATRESPIYVDLFLIDGENRLHNLHASMQLGERQLEGNDWTDRVPATNWGNHVDWIANQAKTDGQKDQKLPFVQQLFPYDGMEFQVLRKKFVGQKWRLRIEVRDFAGQQPDKVFPAKSERKNAEQWLVLDLGSQRN